MSHINEKQWEEMLDLLEEDFVDLIKEYLKDSKVRVEKIREAQVLGDNIIGLNEAHTLKGASANIGADELAKHCFIMQSICQNNMIADAHNVIEDIEAAFIKLADEINQRLAKLS